MQIPYSYHNHTHYSHDSKTTIRELAQAALDAGLTELGIADHFDVHPLYTHRYYFRPDEWWAEFSTRRAEFADKGLSLKAGIEVGEPHRFRSERNGILERYEWDFVVGSLHWVGDERIFDKEYFRQRSPEEAYRLYFQEAEGMVRAGGFDILAHLDICKRVGTQVYGQYDVREWEALVRPVLAACIEQGTALEINTSGLRRNEAQTSPTEIVVQWYHEMGGERLTIGADAHRSHDVAGGLDTAMAYARRAGFTRLTTFTKREVGWVSIE